MFTAEHHVVPEAFLLDISGKKLDLPTANSFAVARDINGLNLAVGDC